MSAPGVLKIRYTNWRGETAIRLIEPFRVWWGNTEWQPENQWFMEAVDVEKGALRDFAVADMVFLSDATPSALAQAPEVQALIRAAELRVTRIAAGLFPGGFDNNMRLVQETLAATPDAPASADAGRAG